MSFRLNRRLFVAGATGLVVAGCDRVATSKPGESALDAASDLTYDASKALPHGQLAPEYAKSEISAFLKPNGSIDPKDPAYKKMAAEKFANYALQVGGLVERPRSFTLAELRAMPPRTQITRHDCVEGWSAIAQWTGVPLHTLLDTVGVKPEARFVVFHCFDNYATDYTTETVSQDNSLDGEAAKFYGSIGMLDATHPQTLLAYAMNDNPLPVGHGAPLRLRVERQLGYKNTKYIAKIELMASFKDLGDGKGGYWKTRATSGTAASDRPEGGTAI